MTGLLRRRDFVTRHVYIWRAFVTSLDFDDGVRTINDGSRRGTIITTATRNSCKLFATTTACVYLAIAILANHIRRILAPWLGQFLWFSAVADMRAARSSPHFFLEDSVKRVSWGQVVRWVVWWYGVSVVGRVARERALGRVGAGGDEVDGDAVGVDGEIDDGVEVAGDDTNQSSHKDTIITPDETVHPRHVQDTRSNERMMDIHRIVHLTLTLALLERSYVESCWASAHLYALYCILIHGSPAQTLFFQRTLSTHIPETLLLFILLLRWLYASLLPNFYSIITAISKQPSKRGVSSEPHSKSSSSRDRRSSGGEGQQRRRLSSLSIRVFCRVNVPLVVCAMAVWYGTAYLVRYSNKYFIVLEMSDMLVTFGWLILCFGVGVVMRVRELL